MIRNEFGENWCTMNKEVIDADCALLFVKPFGMAFLRVKTRCTFKWVENDEMGGRVGGKDYCDGS